MSRFRELVENEMRRCRRNNKICKSWHEVWGIMQEEVDEFIDEVKKKSAKRDRLNALRELVQIASICERAAYDLALIEDSAPVFTNGETVDGITG